MMVIVPRIAAASSLATTPFIYGIEHDPDLRARLLTVSPAEIPAAFRSGDADLALVAADVVPSLSDARIVTDYCIGATGHFACSLLATTGPVAGVRRVYFREEDSASVRLAAWLFAHRWKAAPELLPTDEIVPPATLEPGDAWLLTDERALHDAHRFPDGVDLAAEWRRATHLPFAFAVWVARKGIDPDTVEQLRHALTYGVEHTYEALVAAGYADKPYDAYGAVARIDYLFDNQKHKALQKFWNAGIKVCPRANPG